MNILETTRSVLEMGPVCDCCLGRCFADRTGLTAAERGWALRVVQSLALEEPCKRVDPAECWVCGGAADINFERWTDRVTDALSNVTFETFQIGTRPPEGIADNDRTLRKRAGLPVDAGLTFNAVLNAAIGQRFARRTDAARNSDRPDVVAVLDLVEGNVKVRINPVYLYGRYRKLEPGIVQRVRRCPDCDGTGAIEADNETRRCTRCDGSGRLRSVEESVAWTVSDLMDASDVVFQTAGRESVDMLMLGTGRPFVLEVKEPRHRIVDPRELSAEVRKRTSGTVEVRDLAFAKPDVVGFVAQHSFRQRFELTLGFAEPVEESTYQDATTSLDGTTIHRHLRIEDLDKGQRPHEVVRTLQGVVGTWRDNGTATLEFGVEAGIDPTMVATGNDGQTEPSLAQYLGTTVEVAQVAIVSVEGRDAAFENPEYLLS